jgi:hypothetical protein
LLHIAVARPNSPVRKDKVLESCFSVVSVRTVAAGKLSFGHPEAFFFFLKLLHGRSRFRSSRFRRFLGDLFATASAESATCGLNTNACLQLPTSFTTHMSGKKAKREFCCTSHFLPSAREARIALLKCSQEIAVVTCGRLRRNLEISFSVDAQQKAPGARAKNCDVQQIHVIEK